MTVINLTNDKDASVYKKCTKMILKDMKVSWNEPVNQIYTLVFGVSFSQTASKGA